jgi:hypothetical protein
MYVGSKADQEIRKEMFGHFIQILMFLCGYMVDTAVAALIYSARLTP